MNKLFEKIKDLLKEIAQFFRRIMGPDLSEEELLEDEFGNDYFYKKLNGFNELDPENRMILDQAMKEVVYEDSTMGMEEALKAVKKDKLSLKNTEKSNTRTREMANPKTKPNSKNNIMKPEIKETKSIERDEI